MITFGTDGDVVPFFGLGEGLIARGHRVTLLSNEHYRSLAEERGFSFRTLISNAEMDGILANPDIWHPIKGGLILARLGAQLLERQYAIIAAVAEDEPSTLVANPGVLAARVVQERLRCPAATILFSPCLIPSVCAPPTFSQLSLPQWAPWPIGLLYWRLFDGIATLLVGPKLNGLRKSLGLKPVRRLNQWWLSPNLVIGLFPEWYAPRQPDWPAQIRLAGFLHYDGPATEKLSQELVDFCRSGPPAVAFTLGTGMRHAADFFREAVEASRLAGVRGILLTGHPEQVPQSLPPYIKHCRFAPFGELFPLCAVAVHHGGVGTTARALASGIPQLVLPLGGYDQYDNANRVKQLQAGDWLQSGRRTASCLANALRRLTTSAARVRCREVAQRFGSSDAKETAVQWLEDLTNGRQASGGISTDRRNVGIPAK